MQSVKQHLFPFSQQILLKKWSQDVHLAVLHHQIKFHPDKMESVGEHEANRFCFALNLVTLRQGQGQSKWYKMEDVHGAWQV